jgi:hypothetical protein
MAIYSGEPDVASEDRPEAENPSPGISPKGAARRRLTKAGLGAAGVLWTLESRATIHSGNGFGPICVAPSAAFSGDLNNSTYGPEPKCGARSPDYWCGAQHSWPCSTKLKFDDVFDCYGRNSDKYGKQSLLKIMTDDDFENFVGRHLVATYLNLKSGKINFLSETTLKTMWAELQSKGYYTPAPKVYWTADIVKLYLKATYLDRH